LLLAEEKKLKCLFDDDPSQDPSVRVEREHPFILRRLRINASLSVAMLEATETTC
jgi:hypothetical protein